MVEFSFRGNSTLSGFAPVWKRTKFFCLAILCKTKLWLQQSSIFHQGNKQKIPLQGACKTTVSSSTATFPVHETNHLIKRIGWMISFELGPQFSPAKEQTIIHRCERAKEKHSLSNFSSKKQMMKCWIIMISWVTWSPNHYKWVNRKTLIIYTADLPQFYAIHYSQ